MGLPHMGLMVHHLKSLKMLQVLLLLQQLLLLLQAIVILIFSGLSILELGPHEFDHLG